MRDPLFQPIKINAMEVKNRICMSAMHTNMCVDFEVTDQIIDFYAERARGGVGMITVGFATVDEFSGSKLCLGAQSDAFVPGLRRLANTIKENGAKSLVQLNHAGRYVRSRDIQGQQPVAPSAVASRYTGEEPRELALEEIGPLIDRFAQAARRVKEAGFDGLEVLCGTGYLVSEFLSLLTNKRTDAYGGSLENRMRFGLEVIQAIRNEVGSDFPILVRMNGNDFMPNGNGRLELQEFAQALVAVGADALNINVGWHEARVPQIVTAVPRGAFAYLAREIKALVDVPVISGHRINDPDTAREMIADGMCDMVSMARPLIADPQLPEKARQGRETEIMHCIACGQGCFDKMLVEKTIECLCNPKVGHEKDAQIKKVSQPQRVLVVGGGAAGLSAALSASEAGHEVMVYEKESQLGGQLPLAGSPPGREEFKELARDLASQVDVAGIRVELNQSVDEELIVKEAPDVVILATGATPITPPIPGVELPHVVQAWDVLTDKVTTGKKVVVIGGGAVGVETAQALAEKGTISGDALKFLLVNQAEDLASLYEMATRGTKEVVLIEMIDKIGKDIGLTTRWTMMQDISRSGVTLLKSTKALEITPTGLKVERNGEVTELPCDTVVLAAGSRSCNPLQESLEKMNIPCQVIGDAQKIGLAFDAVHAGYAAGKRIK